MSKLVSVLVPVYNQEKYVKECLDSLLEQTYDNFEIVVLDDGSTDDTPNILKEYASNPKVRLLYKKNEKSIARARNFLLKEIRGDYFVFVDSDDSVSPSFLSLLVEAIEKRDSDIACCNYSLVHIFGTSKEVKRYETMVRKYAIREMILGTRGQYILWNKLIKSELVKDMQFADMSFGEDFIFIFDLMQKDVKTAFISNQLYFYRYFVNRRKKNTIDISKKKFLNKMLEMEKDPNNYLEDKDLLSTWIVATSMYYLTIAKGIYRLALKNYISKRKDKIGTLLKALPIRFVKMLLGY